KGRESRPVAEWQWRRLKYCVAFVPSGGTLVGRPLILQMTQTEVGYCRERRIYCGIILCLPPNAVNCGEMLSLSIFEWLTTSPWANFMNGPEWAFPVVESLHFMGLALSIGTIAIVDLRLLGLGMRRQTASQLARDLD